MNSAILPLREFRSAADPQVSTARRFNTVLLAASGPRHGAGAEHEAMALCVEHGAHLHVLSAVAPSDDTGLMVLKTEIETARKTKEDLAKLKEQARQAGIACTTHVRSGDAPDAVILDGAKSLLADIIVMERRGRRGLARLFAGGGRNNGKGRRPRSLRCSRRSLGSEQAVIRATATRPPDRAVPSKSREK